MNTRSLIAASAVLLAAIGCQRDPTSPTSSEQTGAPVAVAVPVTLAFWQVSGGAHHTCAVTTDYRAYCWGYNGNGALGDGTTTNRLTPVAVATTLRFRQVSAGGYHTCAVTTDYWAYCWGRNGGALGDGTNTNRLRPVRVGGGRQIRQIEAGLWHTCGVTYPDNRAYCWGANTDGQLGDGTTTGRLTPVAVLGGLQFRQVGAGGDHACGVTTDDRAFCWGSNKYGQIGDSSTAYRRLKPSRVAGARQWRQIDAGRFHSCAVTTDFRAFCWGNGREGEIGNGKTYLSFWPRAVSGGLLFGRVSTGHYHSCGETTSHRAYCWGSNTDGQLGDGTSYPEHGQSLTPVAVAGGLSFSQMSTGNFHTCAKTSAGVGYCWGWNYYGELGDGTTTDRPTPTAVAGAM